jgi:hypothetical protein
MRFYRRSGPWWTARRHGKIFARNFLNLLVRRLIRLFGDVVHVKGNSRRKHDE